MGKEPWEGAVWKYIVIVFGVLACGFAYLLMHWASGRGDALQVRGSSQIFIHGTPVCITREDDGIVATVGECLRNVPDPGKDDDDSHPFHGRDGMELPPGHPPVDGELNRDRKRILI
jgi:hypothetical protein